MSTGIWVDFVSNLIAKGVAFSYNNYGTSARIYP
jgi:hypothetical protein